MPDWVVFDSASLPGALVTGGCVSIPPRGIWAAARPLIGSAKLGDARELSRTFECFDHAREGAEGFITVTDKPGIGVEMNEEAARKAQLPGTQWFAE